MAGVYRGVNVDQDGRFADKQKQMRARLSFPPEFQKKVDMKKVRLDFIQPWINEKLQDILGFEDDVLYNLVCGQLEEQFPDPRNIQINLTGFLEGRTAGFVAELWKMLLSAQDNLGGIPAELLEKKKAEIASKRMEDEKFKHHLRKEELDTSTKHQREPKENRRRSRSTSVSPSRDTRARLSPQSRENRRHDERPSSHRRDYSSRSARDGSPNKRSGASRWSTSRASEESPPRRHHRT